MVQKNNPTIKEAGKFFSSLKEFPKTPRMPVLFIGHGSPMNAIEDNNLTQMWRKIAKKIPTPQSIIVMSAHWVTTNGSFVTGMAQPKMIYDMYGFPQELYQQNYIALGNPVLAQEINTALCEIQLDHEWGFDHGAWSVLKQMYPDANIPVIQLSVNFGTSPLREAGLMAQLQGLREHGILFIGSGNIVHNLRAINWSNASAHAWATEFDRMSSSLIEQRNLKSLAHYEKLGNAAMMSIPTDEHYRPMLGALALGNAKDALTFFNEDIVMGSVGMRSFILQ